MPNNLGTPERPLRVAIIGSGPSGFYAADSLYKSDLTISVSMFERLPTPYGLVRFGVAPDHSKIKNVIKVYEKTAAHDQFFYYGNVEIGVDLTVHQLRKYFDALVFANGAETDRKLGIHGSELKGNHTATEFVAWYNGHPDFQENVFDLSCETAVIIGQGNVALDVARILTKTIDELKETDITQNALDVLSKSKVKTVHVVGRRGPAQAAFTPVELREFGELANCDPIVRKEDMELSYPSQIELEDPKNAPKKKNCSILEDFAQREEPKKNKRFVLHFKKSPAAIYGIDDENKVGKIYLEKNVLVGEPNHQKSKGTGEKEELKCGIIFRSIGYRGVPITGLPFQEQAGIIPNTEGRVSDSEQIYPGLYTVGWIKRGPSGIIGTNKPDSEETIKHLLDDLKELNPCKNPDNKMLEELLKENNVRYVNFEEWKKIDDEEIKRGQPKGKPREKFVHVKDMLDFLD